MSRFRSLSGAAARVAAAGMVLAVAATASAEGASGEPPPWAAREWAVSAGVFDLVESDRAEGGVEARFGRVGFRLFGRGWELEPGLGALGNEDGGFYGYFTLRLPLEGRRWRAVPFTGGGVYSAGEGKELGGPVEFRSGLEVSVRVRERWRVGVVYSHLSNAVLYERNPGAESLVVAVSFRR